MIPNKPVISNDPVISNEPVIFNEDEADDLYQLFMDPDILMWMMLMKGLPIWTIVMDNLLWKMMFMMTYRSWMYAGRV